MTLPPSQKLVGPSAVMLGVAGGGFTVTVVAALVALHPFAFVTVTLYAPDALAVMDRVVAPLDHAYEKPSGAVSVTDPPSQNEVGPLAVMAGVSGSGFSVTTVGALVAVQPFAVVIVTL